jgi:hypothetical protein
VGDLAASADRLRRRLSVEASEASEVVEDLAASADRLRRRLSVETVSGGEDRRPEHEVETYPEDIG